MVSRESATRNLCHSQPSLIIQIDEDHSNMVKFGIGNHQIGIVASKLEHICTYTHSQTTTQQPTLIQATPYETGPSASDLIPKEIGHEVSPLDDSNIRLNPCPGIFWNDERILSSLRPPERDRRIEQINPNLGNTFNWAYDNVSTGLSEWLRKGSGIFWINGKPASGKSTIMKYLYQDPRTYELLRSGSWKSKARLIMASFFFHHRGNSLQKSFEGLLRSIVSQILEQDRLLLPLLYPILVEKYQSLVTFSGLEDLETDVWALLSHMGISRTSRVTSEVGSVVASQRQLTESRQLGKHLKRMLEFFGVTLAYENPENDVDLDDAENIMSASVNQWSELWGPDLTEWPQSTSWKAILAWIVNRHYWRERIKIHIEAQSWTKEDLEEALRRIIGQSLFKLDLFLSLDALDEYEGRPEFIASFLQDLVQQPDDSDAQLSTRIRILFSSRPWKIFSDDFAACPGFQIHEYTRNDIMDFCIASIPLDDNAERLLLPLITEIVRRSRGVFLWVKLVMRDLATIALQKVHPQEVKGLEQELRKALDTLPDELDDYYRIITHRIPPGTRWETYVILETLCRSDEDVDTETLLKILDCSCSKDYNEAISNPVRLMRGSTKILNGPRLEWDESYVKVVSGGLVEVGGLSEKGKPVWQFMHQTVKEFVENPCFRFLLLGNNNGKFVTENGHSFIAKHLFVSANINKLFLHHAQKSESTTGSSQYDFFATAPHHFYGVVRPKDTGPDFFHSLIDLAVFAGLQLCIGDAHKANPRCIRQNRNDLVRILLRSIAGPQGQVESMDLEHIAGMAKFLVAKGLTIDRNVEGLQLVVQRIWDRYDALLGVTVTGIAHRNSPLPEYERLAVILVEAFTLPQAISSTAISTQPATIGNSKLATKLIHLAPPRLAEALLVRGVDPNSLNTGRDTPMDSVLKYANMLTSRCDFHYQYHLVRLLASYGGVLHSTTWSRWNEWSDRCMDMGLDMRVFQEAGFPLWCSVDLMTDQGSLDTQPRGQHRYLRKYLSRVVRNWKK